MKKVLAMLMAALMVAAMFTGCSSSKPATETTAAAAAAGTVIETGKHSFFVACGDGVLEITEVQPESKKRMPAQVFLNGRGVQEGDLLA